MANMNIIVQDANNLNVQVTPTPTNVIVVDKSTPGVGIESIVPVTIDTLQYLRITYTNGVVQDVGPLTSTAYFGEAPINITGNIISLDTVGINYGGTGATNASDARDNLGLGSIAVQDASNVDITGGSISGVTVAGYIPSSEKGQPDGVATLDSTGKVPTSQIPQFGALIYQGTWNASTNTPTLTSSVGTQGYYYIVSVAGTTNLNGITDWQVNDWAIFNGSIWQKVDNSDLVTSVNGYTGAVVLTTSDISEGTNLYYTDARARSSLSAGTGISYSSSTGVITNSAPDQIVSITGAGTSVVTGTYPNFTVTSADAYTGTVTSVGTGTGLTGGTITTTGTISFSNANVGTWAATPSSANLAAAMTDETGSGLLVFNSNPTLANPNIDVIDFDTTYATTLTAGQLGWDGNNTLGLGMAGGNVIQKIGEDQFFYCKATAAIAKGQVVMFTGAVGASGVPKGAPATGITDGTYIMGIAAEAIANNGFGLVQCFGTLRNVNTNGYADGDILWYNPSVAGGMTNVKPSAPNVKAQMAAVINGGSTGGGTILIRINAGSTLGGTDSNAQITTPSNGQILTYDGADAYWKNTSISAGTGISVSASSTGVLTITNTSPSSGGTVTSVSGTAPISSTGGNTPTISISQAGSSTNGYLSSTDWNTFNNKGSGSVTSVSGTGTVNGLTLTGTVTTSGSLTLGGTLDLSSPPTIGNTTPNTGKFTILTATGDSAFTSTGALAISKGTTAQQPASPVTGMIRYNSSNNQFEGYSGASPAWKSIGGSALSNDTSTASNLYPVFAAATSGTAENLYTSNAKYLYKPSTGDLQASQLVASNGIVVNSKTVSTNYTISAGYSASSAGPITVASGVTVTVSSGSRWVVL